MADLLRDRVTAAVGDQYLIEGELGRGGMSVVYRALDVRLHRRVAIKVLPPELAFDPAIRDRFQREAQTAAQLNHPHIVPIYGVGERDGVAYFVMALVDGESLAVRLGRGRMAEREARRVLAEVADALAYAHARGVVHRDIKPDNILLDRESGRAVVTDFGIARAAQESSRLTVTGVAVGTPAYMSPEQALGERELDGRSDLYSLGVVAYQMLAGAPPFAASNSMALLMKHVGEAPRPLAERRPDLPPALCAAIDRALSKRPEERWPTAGEFRDALLGAPLGSDSGAGAAGWNGARGPAPHRVAGGPPQNKDAPAPAPARHRSHADRTTAPPANRGDPARWPGMLPPLSVPPWGMSRHERNALRRARRSGYDARGEPIPVEQQAIAFRRHLAGSGAGILACWAVNLAATPHFLWAVFPTIGMGIGLFSHAASLWARGITWEQVFGTPRAPGAPPPSKAERLVGRFRRALGWVGASVLGAVASFALGMGAHIDFMVVPFFISLGVGAANVVNAGITSLALRHNGVGLVDAVTGDWRDQALPAGRAAETVAERPGDTAARLVSADVLAGPYGDAVQRAIEDRAAILGIVERLPAADRALLPDVVPTVNALVERVAALAPTLHRLDADLSPDMHVSVERRIASLRGEPESPDRDRRLALLERQQTTLRDLTQRRATLAGQLESAGLALRNLRLDLLKLRSSGVQAAISDVTSATQEARALSREIGHVLAAAAELRKL